MDIYTRVIQNLVNMVDTDTGGSVYRRLCLRWVRIKKTGVAENWYAWITKDSSGHNPMQIYTVLNFQGVETTSSGDRDVDFPIKRI